MSWRRIDLHIHTPNSVDYQQNSVSMLDILKRAEERGLDIIAITDHNSVRGYADLWREIEDLELLEYLDRMLPIERDRLSEFRRLLSRILVLPGFEFTAQFGFHILAIFPEGTSIRKMEHLLMLLGVGEDRFGSGEVGATTDVLRAYEILGEHGALIIGSHVNSAHGIAMQGLRFGGQTKIAYTQHPNLAALEVTDLLPTGNRRSTARFFSGAKSEYPRRMHCIQGSDAHRLDRDPDRESNLGVGDRPTEVLLPEASFAALKALFASDDFERTRPYTPPPDDPVKAARQDGNTAVQVFHESAATKRAQGIVLRDIVALANSGGGTIYLGLSASEKRPIVGVENAPALIAELSREVTTQVAPAIEVVWEERSSDKKTVIVATIAEGGQKPHAIEPGGIFVRRGTESVPASRDEIVRMIVGDDLSTLAPARVEPEANANGHQRRSASQSLLKPAAPQSAPSTWSQSSPQLSERAEVTATEGHSASKQPAGIPPTLLEPYEEVVDPDPVAPTTGIEVVDAFELDGVRYYSLRDLRYHKLIHNVTRDTDRKLWRTVIAQCEKGGLDESAVRWDGDFGFWRSYRQRAGERRYDLVYRGEGDPRIFFGVSESGMSGRWRAFVVPAKTPGKAEAGAEKRPV
ncbi:MAG: putative DNA binding domain-containing protein [Thermomicrobiales bacterium]